MTSRLPRTAPRTRRRLLAAAALAGAAALLACGPGPAAREATGGPVSRISSFDHAALDRILRESVRDERVDYLAIRKLHWADLRAYLDAIAVADPSGLPRDERLALYINLYNATMVRAVIERFRAGYSPSEGLWRVFKEETVRVGGKTISLDDLEHRMIRPEFREPRIHAALVCAARSCPPLLPRAYRSGDLEETLEGNMRRFVSDPSRNRVDRPGRTLRLSKIFDWYADDFGGKDKVPAYVGRYLGEEVGGFEVSFLDYSWELNLAPPGEGRWIRVSARTVPLRSGPGDGDALGSAPRDEVLEVLGEQGGWLRVERPFGLGEAWVEARLTGPFAP